MSWIQTYTGEAFDLLAPDPEKIHIEDIAHALSNICRFGGHSRQFYSVAEHSVLVSRTCEHDPLWGLLHDAAEAYVGDLVQPLKREIPRYRMVEDFLLETIAQKFGLSLPMPAEVKRADEVLLATEQRDIMGICRVPWGDGLPEPLRKARGPHCWDPHVAEARFLQRYCSLTGTRLMAEMLRRLKL